MNCETVKPLLSDFADDTLEAATTWQVQTHLTECASCAQTSRDLRSLKGMLKALPARQPSAQFDASLAQRLAMTRRPEKRQTWQDKLGRTFSAPRLFLRPALALGAALTAVAGVALFFPSPNALPLPPPPPVAMPRTTDRAFVADCVAQRRRDAAGEPLADLAAQNLAGNLDSAAPTAPTPASSADAGLF